MVLKQVQDGDKPSPAEYAIYIYHPPENRQAGHDWEKKETHEDRVFALTRAQQLYDSAAYDKVEVKKICFDRRAACSLDTTIRVFEERAPHNVLMAAALCGLFVCGGLIYGISVLAQKF